MTTRRRIALLPLRHAWRRSLAVVSVLAGGQQEKPRVNADAALSAEFLKGDSATTSTCTRSSKPR